MKLSELAYSDIKIGLEVISAKGTPGEVSDLFQADHRDSTDWITVSWDNGKESTDLHFNFCNVTIKERVMNKNLLAQSAINGVSFEGRHSVVIDGTVIAPTEVTPGLVETLLALNKDVIYSTTQKMIDGNGIVFYPKMNSHSKRPISCYKVFQTCDWEPDCNFDMYYGELFPIVAKKEAIDEFVRRINKKEPAEDKRCFSEEDIMVMTYGWESFTSQYSYCSAMLEEFWKEVFNKSPSEMWCGGIVSAHGDKCYGYRSEWEDAGIHFYRGTMLYFLSYTSEYKKQSRINVSQWVIDQYPNFLPIFEKVEKNVMDEKYTYRAKVE